MISFLKGLHVFASQREENNVLEECTVYFLHAVLLIFDSSFTLDYNWHHITVN